MATTKFQRLEKDLALGNITQEQYNKKFADATKGSYFVNKSTGKLYTRGGKLATPFGTSVPRDQVKQGVSYSVDPQQYNQGSNLLTGQKGAPEGYQMTPGGVKVIPGGIADVPESQVKIGTKGVTDTIFETPKEPETIDEAMEQKTYREQAEEQYKGSYLDFGEAYEKLHGKPAPWNTEAGMLEWRKNQNQEDLDYLDRQQAIARELETSQAMTAAEQIAGAESATRSVMAQSREGAMTTTKPQFVSEFTQQMDRKRQQIVLERQSAENARQNAKQRLQRAQEKGDMDLVEAIEGQIASIEQDIRRVDTEALQAATLANEQAMKAMEVASQKTATVTENLFNLGSIASTLSYDQLENMIVGTDMTMPQALAIQQAAVLQGKAAETKDQFEADKLEAQAKDLLAKAGKTAGQMEYEFFNDLNSTEQAKYLELKRANPNLQFYKMDDGTIINVDPVTGVASTSYVPSDATGWDSDTFKIGKEVGWCGDYAATISTAGSVGDTWDQKKSNIQDQDVSVGDKLLIPLGVTEDGAGWGHVAVVLDYNPSTGDITVAESNKDGRQKTDDGLQGVASFGTYNVNNLNSVYPDNWGVIHGDLKEPYANARTKEDNIDKYIDIAKTEGIETAKDVMGEELSGDDLDKALTLFNEEIRRTPDSAEVVSALEASEVLNYFPSELIDFLKENIEAPSILEKESYKKREATYAFLTTDQRVIEALEGYKDDLDTLAQIIELNYGVELTQSQLENLNNKL